MKMQEMSRIRQRETDTPEERESENAEARNRYEMRNLRMTIGKKHHLQFVSHFL
jgi:hypothetical protein